METNPYDYNNQIPWTPQQHQYYEVSNATNNAGRNEAMGSRLNPPVQKPKPERMPKAHALALAQTLKKWLAVASLVSFGTLSGLAAFHQVGTTATTTSNNTTSSTSSQSTSTTSSSSENDDSSNNGSFFNQPGGNNFGSSNSSQAPVSGSSVS